MHARKIHLLAFAALFATPVPALADQCAYISREMADTAINMLVASSRNAIDFCEPCGDRRPGRPYRITEVLIRDTGYENYWEVLVNGQPVDLAYLFLKTGAFTWTNAAALISCETHDVSPKLFMPRLKAAFAPKRTVDETFAD